MLSRVRLFATPWTVAREAPLSMGFSRQEFWNGLPLPPPGDLPYPGIEPVSPAWQANSLPSEPPGKPREVPGLQTSTDSKVGSREKSAHQRLSPLPTVRPLLPRQEAGPVVSVLPWRASFSRHTCVFCPLSPDGQHTGHLSVCFPFASSTVILEIAPYPFSELKGRAHNRPHHTHGNRCCS